MHLTLNEHHDDDDLFLLLLLNMRPRLNNFLYPPLFLSVR